MSEYTDQRPGKEEALNVVEVLFRRFDVVKSLLEEPKDKRELVEDVDISRSTVDRATKELETAGLIEYIDGQFVVTVFGEVSKTELTGLLDMVSLRHQLEAFLQWIPDSQAGFELESVVDADIVVAEPGNPYNMVNEHVSAIEEASSVRAVLPVTGLHAFEAAHEAVVNNGADYEFIVSPDIKETYESNPNYASLYEEIVETDRFDLYVFEGSIPYYLGLLDEAVQIGVDEAGDPRALLTTDSSEMREWAESEHENYRQQAKKVV